MVRLQGFRGLATRPIPPKQAVHHQEALSRPRRDLTVLGIETSADDTCVALLTRERGTYALKYHERISCNNTKHRGIHPGEAVVSHTQHLPRLIHNVMQSFPHSSYPDSHIIVDYDEAVGSTRRGLAFDKLSQQAARPPYIWRKPDLIAVTRGPGMGTCLGIGVSTAKALSVAWQVPVIGVHHMQAHALTPLMEVDLQKNSGVATPREDIAEFPFLTLLVSGKHTMLVHTKSITNHRILASVQQPGIALGDLLDKCARDIVPKSHIPQDAEAIVYPKLMEELVGKSRISDYQAVQDRTSEIHVYQSEHGWDISPPLRDTRDLVYDYSGLNGRVQTILRERPSMPDEERQDLAFHTMRVAFEHLMSRVILALQADEDLQAEPPTRLMLSGGVASNFFLRHVAQSTLRARGYPDITVVAPDPKWCTDNAAMIAYAGARMNDAGWLSEIDFCTHTKWSIEEIISGVDGWVQQLSHVSCELRGAAINASDRNSTETEAPQAGSEPDKKGKLVDGTPKETSRAESKQGRRIQTQETAEEQRASPSAELRDLIAALQVEVGHLRKEREERNRHRRSSDESDKRVPHKPVLHKGPPGQPTRKSNVVDKKARSYQHRPPPGSEKKMRLPPKKRNTSNGQFGVQWREATKAFPKAPAPSPTNRDSKDLPEARPQSKSASNSGKETERKASIVKSPDPMSEISSSEADLQSPRGEQKPQQQAARKESAGGVAAVDAAVIAADQNSTKKYTAPDYNSAKNHVGGLEPTPQPPPQPPSQKEGDAIDQYFESLKRRQRVAEMQRKIWSLYKKEQKEQRSAKQKIRKLGWLPPPPSPEPTPRKQAQSGAIMSKVAQIGDMIRATLGLRTK